MQRSLNNVRRTQNISQTASGQNAVDGRKLATHEAIQAGRNYLLGAPGLTLDAGGQHYGEHAAYHATSARILRRHDRERVERPQNLIHDR